MWRSTRFRGCTGTVLVASLFMVPNRAMVSYDYFSLTINSPTTRFGSVLKIKFYNGPVWFGLVRVGSDRVGSDRFG